VLQNPDVRNWMSEVFPLDLKRLKDSKKEPLDLARIQNEALRLSLEEVWVQLHRQSADRLPAAVAVTLWTAVLKPGSMWDWAGHQLHNSGGFTACLQLSYQVRSTFSNHLVFRCLEYLLLL
jgi:hypothetical protein